MWNDTDIPLAYLITFRSYGTWLHGDERGSIDRFQNKYQTPYMPPNQRWLGYNKKALRGEPVILSTKQRACVEAAIRETCEARKWHLHALNARTNHVHSVVSIGTTKPERALNDLKAYATRRMRREGCWSRPDSPWSDKGSKRSDKGSKRRLWNRRSIERAVDYVINGQGGDPPEFD